MKGEGREAGSVGLGEINQGRSWLGSIACAALVAATCLSSARGLCHPLSDKRLSPIVLFSPFYRSMLCITSLTFDSTNAVQYTIRRS